MSEEKIFIDERQEEEKVIFRREEWIDLVSVRFSPNTYTPVNKPSVKGRCPAFLAGLAGRTGYLGT
jgi:hypothetical protein